MWSGSERAGIGAPEIAPPSPSPPTPHACQLGACPSAAWAPSPSAARSVEGVGAEPGRHRDWGGQSFCPFFLARAAGYRRAGCSLRKSGRLHPTRRVPWRGALFREPEHLSLTCKGATARGAWGPSRPSA